MAKIELRKVSFFRDARYLYEALARRPAHIGISHRAMPPFWKHLRFMLSRPYAAWYTIQMHYLDFMLFPHTLTPVQVVASEWFPVGNIYLTRQNEIGIFLDPQFQGKGFGKVAIQLLRIKQPRRKYLANIAPGNDLSIGFFKSLGFKHIQNTYELRGK